MSKKDNQHFVQRAYLKGFAHENTPGELWEYDKKTKSISHRIKSTREICSMYQYYAAPGEDGEIDPEVIENALHVVEDPFIRILRTIQPKEEGEQIPSPMNSFQILLTMLECNFPVCLCTEVRLKIS